MSETGKGNPETMSAHTPESARAVSKILGMDERASRCLLSWKVQEGKIINIYQGQDGKVYEEVEK